MRVANLRGGLPFKDLELEPHLNKDPTIPASQLAITKELELQRVHDCEAATTDEARHRRSDTTREPFEACVGTKEYFSNRRQQKTQQLIEFTGFI